MGQATDPKIRYYTTLVQQHEELLRLCQQLTVLSAKGGSAVSKEQFHEVLNDLVRCAGEHFRTEERFFAKLGQAFPPARYEERLAFEEWLTDALLATAFGVIDRAGFSQQLSRWWEAHDRAAEWRAVDALADDGALPGGSERGTLNTSAGER